MAAAPFPAVSDSKHPSTQTAVKTAECICLNWVSISCSALWSPMGLGTECLVGCCCEECSQVGDLNLKLKDHLVSKWGKNAQA